MTLVILDEDILKKFKLAERDADIHNINEAFKLLQVKQDKKDITKIKRFIGSKKRGAVEQTSDLDSVIALKNIAEGKLRAISKLTVIYNEDIKEGITKRRKYRELTEALILDIQVITESTRC